MESQQHEGTDGLQILIEEAVSNDTIPTIYFNGFVNAIGTGDVLIVLNRQNKPVAKLHASYTVAKTLAEKLGGLIAKLEHDSGNTIMTTDTINEALKGRTDHDDGTD